MGRIERLRTITIDRIEAFLASLETPETVVPQLVREMADCVGEAARAEAKALTAVKADRRRLDAANGRVDRLLNGAKLALKAEELETARQAVAAQIEAEREVACCRERLAVSESAYESAGHVRKQLHDQLDELKLRKQEILARVRILRQREHVRRPRPGATGTRTRNILDVISRMEVKVQEEEAHLEIQDEIRRTLGVTFEHERAIERENDAEVDRRLDVLRGTMAQDGSP
jgi:phage shock protein A